MAYYFVSKTVTLFSFYTLIIALPILPEETRPAIPAVSQFRVNVTQSSIAMPEKSKLTSLWIKQCTDIVDENTPTRIQIQGHSTKPLKLITYSSSSCSSNPVESLPLNSTTGVVVNDRIPICSFQLRQKTRADRQATVTLSSATGNFIRNLTSTTCNDLCSSGSSWAKFAQSVYIKVNGEESSNAIRIFSSTKCEYQESEVGNGSDLVALTRKNNIIIRSIKFDYAL